MHPTIQSITTLHKCAVALAQFRGCEGLDLPLKKVSINTSAGLVLRACTAAKVMADELRRSRTMDEQQRREVAFLLEAFANLSGLARYKVAEISMYDLSGRVGDASDFTAVEVNGVKSSPDGISVNEDCPDFFSVYLRHKDHTAICIGDFGVPKTALAFAHGIAQKNGLTLKADRLMPDLVFQQLLASA